jgi:multidrug transporter EmrE-like cation transporter
MMSNIEVILNIVSLKFKYRLNDKNSGSKFLKVKNILKTYLFLAFSILLGASGQLLLKFSVINMGTINLSWGTLLPTVTKIFTNGWILLGLLLFGTSMVFWIKVISTMELSRAYPSVSLSYVLIFAFSIILFKEEVTSWKVLGLLSILMGVFLLHR